jgi:hypothetical protein
MKFKFFRKTFGGGGGLKYQWEPNVFVRTDRRMDMIKQIVASCNVANAPVKTTKNIQNSYEINITVLS